MYDDVFSPTPSGPSSSPATPALLVLARRARVAVTMQVRGGSTGGGGAWGAALVVVVHGGQRWCTVPAGAQAGAALLQEVAG